MPVYLPALLASVLAITAYPSPLTCQIQDNSFLIEEAYNQERGVVQHISTFERSNEGGWLYSFTQEWPLGGIRHQLSYTIPVENIDRAGTGFGDLALNYRYQLVGTPEERTVLAPRFSVLLPTGNEKVGRGAGGLGLQLNLPLTLVLNRRFVSHWNVGATFTPSASNALGQKATTHSTNLGASLVWLFRPSINFLLEAVLEDSPQVIGEGRVRGETSWTLSPGLRWAFDFAGDLQVVPGVAYALALGEGSDDNAVFLYLSIEHPFSPQ